MWRAALLWGHRFEYAVARDRRRELSDLERRAYEDKLALDREVVPELKEKARQLRQEIRGLERELQAAGVDPARIEPTIDWDRTLAVEASPGPQYESNEERRARVIGFFRRYE